VITVGCLSQGQFLCEKVDLNISFPFSQGPLQIVRMFGSILTPEGPGFRCLSVTLACADCSVVGGVIAGPLIAATTVQVSSDAQIS
jgi:hypothetical protein